MAYGSVGAATPAFTPRVRVITQRQAYREREIDKSLGRNAKAPTAASPAHGAPREAQSEAFIPAQTSVITHDPRAGLTPSQIRDADETKARRARFEARAFVPPISTPSGRIYRVEPEQVAQVEPPVFKEPWFSIEREIEGPLRIDVIQRVVLKRYPKVTRADMLSARRTKDVVRPRQIAMYLAKMLTPKSLPEIGRGFGGRDHTTILHAVRKIARLVEEDAELAADIAVMSGILQPNELEAA